MASLGQSTTSPSAVPNFAGQQPDKEMAVDKYSDVTAQDFLSVATTPNGGSSAASRSGDDYLAEKATLPSESEETKSSPRKAKGIVWGLIVVAVLSSCFLFALDNTIVADIQPAIVERFDDIGKLPWLSAGFFVGALSTNLIWGKIYGQFNAKHLYLFTVFMFEAGSAVCGAAPNLNALIIGRVICGIGGSGMYIGTMTLLSVNTTNHERPTYIALTGLTWGLGTLLGPIIGGAFTNSSATWRWAFYINLVVGGVFAPVYIFLLPSFDPRPDVPNKKRFLELDFVGTLLATSAFCSGVMALSFGGTTYAWNSGRIIGLFVTSGVLLVLFGVQQVYTIFTTEERRIFPVQFLRRRSLLILFAMTSAAGTCIFVPILFIPIYFQFVRSDTALEAGVRLLPFICLLVLFCMINGAVMSKTGYYMPWYLGGGILSVIGSALMFTVTESSSISHIYGYSVVLAIGTGSFVQASFSVAQAKVKPHEIPLAVGFITCAQVSGATIAVAIANSIFLNQSTHQIRQILPDVPLETVRSAVAGSGSALFKSLTPETKALVLHAIVRSISHVYILAMTAGTLAVVLSLLMKREKLFLEAGGAA